jgi:uncharacterized protein YndB with AHSA1/START domain
VSSPTSVDESAPVIARHEIDIDAPVAVVWELHTDVNSWPSWQKDITSAHMEGSFQPGTSFDWESFGFPVTSTIYEVQPQTRVLWGGTAQGITGVHEWLLSATPQGVRVTTNESFAGGAVDADQAAMQSQLDASLASWLGHMKAAAEDRVRSKR